MDRSARADDGTTLIELVVVIALLSVVAALGVSTLRGYRTAADQRSLAQETLSLIRTASTQAVARSTPYCVRIAADGASAASYRGTCDTGSLVGRLVAPGRSRYASPAFGSPGGRDIVLSPRGTATGGTTSVVRGDGTGTALVVRVEALTSRVSYA